MDSKQRIEKILIYLSINAKELATSIGINRPDVIYHILNGRNGISRNLASKIHNKYNISYEWLLTGEGEMIKDEINSLKTEPTTLNNNNEIAELKKDIERYKRQIDFLMDELENEKAIPKSEFKNEQEYLDIIELLKGQLDTNSDYLEGIFNEIRELREENKQLKEQINTQQKQAV